jgi:hypothetical protein
MERVNVLSKSDMAKFYADCDRSDALGVIDPAVAVAESNLMALGERRLPVDRGQDGRLSTAFVKSLSGAPFIRMRDDSGI